MIAYEIKSPRLLIFELGCKDNSNNLLSSQKRIGNLPDLRRSTKTFLNRRLLNMNKQLKSRVSTYIQDVYLPWYHCIGLDLIIEDRTGGPAMQAQNLGAFFVGDG